VRVDGFEVEIDGGIHAGARGFGLGEAHAILETPRCSMRTCASFTRS
jgi:hypothetical protein